MSYTRVIPRDLFNESSLLKCYGRIYINLERVSHSSARLVHSGNTFDVELNEASGGLSISNVTLMVRGAACYMERPLNSRLTWPLYLTRPDNEDELCIFKEETGDFSEEMLAFINGETP